MLGGGAATANPRDIVCHDHKTLRPLRSSGPRQLRRFVTTTRIIRTLVSNR